jgi:predicted transcriptional regulator
MSEGILTPAQHEIMQIIWNSGRCGISVGSIWKKISESRSVARTTILKMVDRLEQREWICRRAPKPNQKGAAMRYFPKIGPRKARAMMLQQFVNNYYDGSAAELAKSLLKWKCLTLGDMGELKQMLIERMDR